MFVRAMSRKAPAVQFYAEDFLGGTRFMSNAEVGLYIRLLCEQVDKGFVLDDVEQYAKAYKPEVRKLWSSVRSKFVDGPTPGTMVNERMAAAINAREAFRARQSQRGKASAESRSASTTVQPRFNHGSTKSLVEPLGDGDGDIKSSGKERARAKPKIPFLDWWSLYAKGSKKLSAEQWDRLSDEDRAACIAATPAYLAAKPDKTYRKDGERFLRHRTWEDPIVIPNPTQPNGLMTKEQAREELKKVRERLGIAPGGTIETHMIPEPIRKALAQP